MVRLLSIFRYGHEAVIFFFVLSGFVIHFSYAKKLHTQRGNARFDGASYLVRRARRLYPPLLFAMLLTVGLDRWGMAMRFPIYFASTPYPLINTSIHPDHSALTAIGNLLFLMESWVPSWGTDGPLWSLHFEWWFYMLYPVLWWLTRRSIVLSSSVVLVMFLLSLLPGGWPLPGFAAHGVPQIFCALLTWWLGAVLASIVAARAKAWLPWLATLTPLLVAVPMLTGEHSWTIDTLYGLGFTGLLALCLWLRELGWSLHWLERLKPFGDMSYTLYITHFPILVFLSGWLMSRSPDTALPTHFGWILAGSLFAMAFAYAAHFAVEKPFLSRARIRVP
jgi:peptidoglycan/LPS O-acetylase OafA/YrhL